MSNELNAIILSVFTSITTLAGVFIQAYITDRREKQKVKEMRLENLYNNRFEFYKNFYIKIGQLYRFMLSHIILLSERTDEIVVKKIRHLIENLVNYYYENELYVKNERINCYYNSLHFIEMELINMKDESGFISTACAYKIIGELEVLSKSIKKDIGVDLLEE